MEFRMQQYLGDYLHHPTTIFQAEDAISAQNYADANATKGTVVKLYHSGEEEPFAVKNLDNTWWPCEKAIFQLTDKTKMLVVDTPDGVTLKLWETHQKPLSLIATDQNHLFALLNSVTKGISILRRQK